MIFIVVCAAYGIGWLAAKFMMYLYEQRQIRNIEKQKKFYMDQNQKEYEQEENKRTSGEDQEIPKRN